MSKSKGNVIDPLIVMDQFGTDAFRFTLTAFAAQGRDIKLSEERIAGYQQLCQQDLERGPLHPDEPGRRRTGRAARDLSPAWRTAGFSPGSAGWPRKWAGPIEEYRFNEAASSAYQFVWHEFCDWYLETGQGAAIRR